MPQVKILKEKVTRSVVLDRAEVEALEEVAQRNRQSLSSVVRSAVSLFLAQEVKEDNAKGIASN